MIIADQYSHADGESYISENYPSVLAELKMVIGLINAESCRLKVPKGNEKNKAKRAGVEKFYSPIHLNALFDYFFFQKGWDIKPRIKTHDSKREGFREMDAMKDKVGVEIQFGKYAFLTYDIVAKMVIFKNYRIIDCGVEICPMQSMLLELSSGIGAFEQVSWDLRHREVANIDIPVLVLGIAPDPKPFAIAEHRPEDEDSKSRPSRKHGDSLPEIVLHRYKKLSKNTLKAVQETGIDISAEDPRSLF
ncbi:MAG TPA: BglII/BstYI family type II restriction endonuclease [Nitrososphaera sp.]|nr:BglII/BstYI family type II restriction endonuclease [Nitrososphaera sp.]